jgi:hypothetical protein
MTIARKLNTAAVLARSDRAGLFHALGLARGTENQKRTWLDVLAYRYFNRSGLRECFTDTKQQTERFQLFISPHKVWDIVNLHRAVTSRTVNNVIEFGCGISTVALAHAIRKRGKGMVHVVEASQRWADETQKKLQGVGLDKYVTFHVSVPRLRELNGQVCHVFDKLPDVRPDLIYLDGPGGDSIEGDVHGITRVGLIVAADPLFYEWQTWPGFTMIVDGRFTNVQFLKANLRRAYKVRTKWLRNVTTFALIR